MSFIVRILPEIVLPGFLKKLNSKFLIMTIIFSIVLLLSIQSAYPVSFSFNQTNLSNNDGNSREPQLVAIGNNVFVVWRDNTSGNDEILFKRSTNNGVFFDSEINLSGDSGASREPQIDVSGNNVYVSWTNATISNGEIFFKRSTNSGSSFVAGSTNLSNNLGNSDFSKMQAVGSSVYVIWRDFTSDSNGDILFKNSTDNGVSFFGNAVINLSSDSSTSREEQIAISGNNIYVVWRNDTGNGEILFKKSTDNGATFDATATNLSSNSGNSLVPQIAASGSNVYVVWRDFTSGNSEILFKKSTNNGATFDATATNLSSNSGISQTPQIAASGSNVYVTWKDSTPTGSNNDILFKGSDDNGSTFSSTKNLSNNVGFSTTPQIAESGTDVYVVWDDDTGDLQGDGDTLFSVGSPTTIDISFDSNEYKLSDTAIIAVVDPASNTLSGTIETIPITVTSTTDPSGISLTLTETGANSGNFTNSFTFTSSTSSGSALRASAGDIITGAFGGETGFSGIFPRIVSFEFSQYTLSDIAEITVTDQSSNTLPGTIETIPITVTSTTDPSGISLTLTETGANSGIFQNTGLILMTGNDLFQLSDTATVSLDDNTINLDSNAIETVSMSVTSSSDSTGIPSFVLSETDIDTGIFSATLGFTTGSSNSTHIEVAGGDILSISYLGETSNGLILPNSNAGLGAIQAGIGDTVTASYLGSSGSATIVLGSGGGGAGGGLVRPTVVLDFIAGLLGGGGSGNAPTTSLTTLSTNPNFEMPAEVRAIVENFDPLVPLSPMNPDVFENFDFPFTIKYNPYNGYPLAGYENTIETNIIEVGIPITLTFTFYEQSELVHVSLYTNLNGIKTKIDQSDTQILYYKDKPIEIIDPHGYFADVKFLLNELDDIKKQATFEITFSNEMEQSDIIIRSWNEKLQSSDTIIRDAIEVVKANPIETFEEDIPVPEVSTTKLHVPIWIKNNASWWSEDLIDDSDFIAGIEYLIQQEIISVSETEDVSVIKSNKIPLWIKNNAGWWSEDLITEQDFLGGIQWLLTNGIIRI